jgi:hypothetical protein
VIARHGFRRYLRLNASNPVFPFAFGDLYEIEIVMLHSLKNTFFTNFWARWAIVIFQRQPY